MSAAMPPDDPCEFPKGQSFGELLQWLLLRGVRPREAINQGTAWTSKAFAAQVLRSPRQVANWISNKSLPRFDDLPAIERVFFGTDQTYQQPLRLELRDALKRSPTQSGPTLEQRDGTGRGNAENDEGTEAAVGSEVSFSPDAMMDTLIKLLALQYPWGEWSDRRHLKMSPSRSTEICTCWRHAYLLSSGTIACNMSASKELGHDAA
jgi:hypothetical protein